MLRFVDLEPDEPQELTRLPGGEQGPSQGPYTPIQRIPGMGWGPDGREPAPDFQRPLKQAKSSSQSSSTRPDGTAQA